MTDFAQTTAPLVPPAADGRSDRPSTPLPRSVSRLGTGIHRFGRKHALALLVAGLFNVIVFFPLLFMGRVLSPNDVFLNYDPWAIYRTTEVQNSLLNDPPTAYLTMMSLLKSDWRSFHWDRYVGSGIPGFGSAYAAVLTPLVALPTLLLPLTGVYSGIIFLKLNVAFLFAYLWLREERLGKMPAAIGAIIVAGAGIYSVRWLWQSTNATALYPAMLWSVRRGFAGKRNALWLLVVLGLSYAYAGFPAAMAYGVYMTAAYAAFLAVRERVLPLRAAGGFVAAAGISLAISSPSLAAFAALIQRSGYLDIRSDMSSRYFFPSSHWLSFLLPQRLGNNAFKNWVGDPHLYLLNNYVEATVYVGILTLLLALWGVFERRARSRGFWSVAAVVILGCMFGAPLIAPLFAALPGFRYSPLPRTVVLLPVALGYLAAAGSRVIHNGLITRNPTRRWIAATALIAAGLFCSGDNALLAGSFFPYLEPAAAEVRATPVIQFLQSQRGEFRVAPMFTFLWPNSSELFRIQDIRAHFASEKKYRDLLQRIDPTCWSGRSTVIQFNSLHFNPDDPFLSMLGVRYLLEHKAIDILRWGIYKKTEAAVPERNNITLLPGVTLQRTIVVDRQPFYAIELALGMTGARGADPRVEVSLTDASAGTLLFARTLRVDELKETDKVYLPLYPDVPFGAGVLLKVRSHGVTATLRGGGAPSGESPLFYGRVMTPIILDRELPDARIFRNLAEVPRYVAIWATRRASHEQLLRMTDIDFGREAVVDPSAGDFSELDRIPPASRKAHLRVRPFSDGDQTVETTADVPFLLSSSEKLTPELGVTIDRVVAALVPVNSVFAAVRIPAGRHTVVFSRRLGRRWWPVSVAGLLGLLLAVGFDVRYALRRGRATRMI
jgi:hypothetical protein